MSPSRTARRLPGFRFETVAPPLAEWLPRMDVACFVGFAASGPVDTPVAVESVAHFEALFGADAPLAWDAQAGALVSACLAPCVRAFFANGGLRCWVIRVARRASPASKLSANKLDRARYNYFPLPGLAAAALDAQGHITKLNPAFARARSEGSWSDAHTVSTALLSRSVEIVRTDAGKFALDWKAGTVDLAVDTPDDIAPGDLLRFTFREGYVLLFYVKGVTQLSASGAGRRASVRAEAAQVVWLQTRAPAGYELGQMRVVQARVFTAEPDDATNASEEQTVFDRFLRFYEGLLQPVNEDASALAGQSVTLDIYVAPSDAPAPGSLVAVDLPQSKLWITVQETSVTGQAFDMTATGVRVIGQGVWWIGAAPDPLPEEIVEAEQLSFELWVRSDGEYALSLSDLAFHPQQARFWAQLPTDEEVYQLDDSAPTTAPTEGLWQPVGGELRFPLAGSPVDGSAIYLPLAVQAIPEQFLGPVHLAGTTLERDGLAEFDVGLFLDSALTDATAEDLLSRADFLRYLAPAPRRLGGIHAALEVEEITLVAVPDASQRGWTKSEPERPTRPTPSEPLPRPDWWRFDCQKRQQPPLVHEPPYDQFLDCGLRVVAPPVLETTTDLTASGTFTLSWSSGETGAQFVLEEGDALDDAKRITDTRVIYAGALKQLTLYGRGTGDYYYRVRAVAADGNTSDWSNGVAVRVAKASAWASIAESGYDNSALLALQRALVRLAAARGDLLAVLSLPEHYREDKTLEHVALLKQIAGDRTNKSLPTATTLQGVPPFGGGEAQVFSYAALYHPWLVGDSTSTQSAPGSVPPDGAACGVLAQRALTRGAWIAPANEALRGVVALTPTVRRERWLDLQDAQLNLVRQEARGFLCLNADTLSDDDSLRLINVRRLLILLRRLALRHGATYVFEPNSDAFRRSVERGFSSLLDLMFTRGAFAGATAATSYQVRADNTLNPPQSVEQGRFIVELRVAPSQPMTFMTIRLVQTGARGEVTEVA